MFNDILILMGLFAFAAFTVTVITEHFRNR